MKVFLSWSGQRSHSVAELLDQWLRCVVQAAEPWLSSEGIERGSVWFTEISSKLSDTSVGIICLTEENKNKPWILFEAGAISKGLTSNRVCTLLIDLNHQDIENPLAQFNHTLPTREGLWNLVLTINSSMGDRGLSDRVLKRVFETYWPEFEKSLAEILANTPTPKEPKKRKEGEVMSEMLEAVRSMERRMYRLEETAAIGRQPLDSSSRVSTTLPSREAKAILNELVQTDLTDATIVETLVSLGAPQGWVQRRLREMRNRSKLLFIDTDNPSEQIPG